MSSRYEAMLAREALFALEALEPRRFLSGENSVAEAIPLDVAAGVTLAGAFASDTVLFSFDAQAGEDYIFRDREIADRISVLAEDGQTVLLDARWYHAFHWTAPNSGKFYLSLYYKDGATIGRQYVLNAYTAGERWDEERAAAIPFDSNNEVSGELDGLADEDWYSFQADPANTYKLEVEDSEDCCVSMMTYTPEGLPTAEYDSEYDMLVHPQVTGTYYLKVMPEDSDFSGGNFTIHIEPIANDNNEDTAHASPWDISQPLSGELAYEGDEDYYSFEAKEGDAWVLNFTGNKWISILDSDGQSELGRIESTRSNDAVYGQLVWRAPHDGNFFLAVTPNNGWSYSPTGAYVVTATPLVETAPIPIAADETKFAALESPGQMDQFAFEATAGTYYHFHISWIEPSDAGLMMHLDGPPSSGWGGVDSIWREYIFGTRHLQPDVYWIAPASGTFNLQVTAFDASVTGGYMLSMESAADDHRNVIDQATPLAVGQAIRGRIDYDVDADDFAVAGEAGHRYQVYVIADQRSAESWGPEFSDNSGMYDGEYVDLGECKSDGAVERCDFIADETRPYIYPVYGGEIGEGYSVYVTDGGSPAPSDAEAIENGRSIDLDFDGTERQRYLRIDAQAGAWYRFQFSIAAHGKLDLDVVDETGHPIEMAHNEWSDAVREQLEGEWLWYAYRTRTVYLRISNIDPGLVAHYTMTMESAADPAADFWARKTVKLDEPLEVRMAQYGRESAYVRFEAAANTKYRVTVRSYNYTEGIKLIQPDGRTTGDLDVAHHYLETDTDYDETTEASWQSTAEGVYYLRIDESWAYQFEVSITLDDRVPAESEPSDPPDREEPGHRVASANAVLGEGASGVFAFHAIGGNTYKFRTVLGTLDDSVLGLFDPLTQTVIAVNDDTDDEALWDDDVQAYSSQVQWTADRSGDFYVIVYSADWESGGNYRLEVYSSGAALKEERLMPRAVAVARANELVAAVDDALYAEEEDSSSDDSDVWDDSQDSWDDSSDWVDSDVWEEEE